MMKQRRQMRTNRGCLDDMDEHGTNCPKVENMEAMKYVEGVAIHELLLKRRSGRSFDANRPLTNEDIHALLEAARWAPSGGNLQPWRFVMGRKGDATHDTLTALLAEFIRQWAQFAPALVLTVYQTARVASDGNVQPNRTAQHDLGMANLSLAIEAVNRGMMTRMMGGFDRDAALKLIEAEANHLDVGPIIAVGYEAEPIHLSEEIQKRDKMPRTRKPIEELLLKI
jgi:nitroreductase